MRKFLRALVTKPHYILPLGCHVLVLLLAPAWCQQPRDIEIQGFAFQPKTVTVAVGTVVTWINKDQTPHKVVGKDGTVLCGVIDTNEKGSHRFTQPGQYEYYCSLHPQMTAVITVVKK